MKTKTTIRTYNYLVLMILTICINSCAKDDEIIKMDVSINWSNPNDIDSETPLSAEQLNATADVSGTFVYTPDIGTVLSVGDNQSLKVEFTPSDISKYNTATKTVTINVKEPFFVTDYDGNRYHTVVIGTQTWMLENLKVTHYRNGDPIPNITDDSEWLNLTNGAFCWYNNDIDNKTVFGALYNWNAVSDSRNIAPVGWHVATDSDWTTLTNYLGGENVAGGKLKEIGLSHWKSPNTEATNSTGFTALPGGFRLQDGINMAFLRISDIGGWWSATEDINDKAWSRYMGYDHSTVVRYNDYKKSGFSVRCVKD